MSRQLQVEEFQTDPSGATVPGTGETPPATPDSSAGTQNTDTGQGNGPPETIPYARFKEVNDALRPFKELEARGYSADQLQRLVEWEQEFEADPGNAWLRIADQIKGNLPDPVKQALDAIVAAPPAGKPDSVGEGDSDKPPKWFSEVVERDIKPLKEDLEQRRQNDEMARRDGILNSILQLWDEADKKDKIETPRATMLTYISSAAASGEANTAEEVFDLARKQALGYRESVLKGAVQPGQGPTPPASVPGSGAPAGAPPITPKTFEEARALAKAAAEQGRL